jgi:hypothetical protein
MSEAYIKLENNLDKKKKVKQTGLPEQMGSRIDNGSRNLNASPPISVGGHRAYNFNFLNIVFAQICSHTTKPAGTSR